MASPGTASTRPRLKHPWIAAAVGLLVLAAAFFGPFLEAGHEGPYTRWYMTKKRDEALRTHLVGRPMKDVEKVLGRADRIRYRPPGTISQADGGMRLTGQPPYVRIDYLPYPWVPVSFQVYCRDGVVTSLKMNDDTVR